MRKPRSTIGGLMTAIVLLAIGFSGVLRPATWTGVIALLTWGVLVFASAGAVLGRPKDRAYWTGFALFGWSYLALAFWIWPRFNLPMPLVKLGLILEQAFPNDYNASMISVFGGTTDFDLITPVYGTVLHHVFALLAGYLGALICRACFGDVGPRSEAQASPLPPKQPRSRWLWIVVSASIIAPWATAAVAILARSHPDVWAAITYLLMAGLLGMAALVALLGRGKAREAAIGAALFGFGYLVLAFYRAPNPMIEDFQAPPSPILVTDQWLLASRAWLYRVPESMLAADQRIRQALERPVPMHFPDKVRLDDFLKYIASSTATPDWQGIPIYVDPFGLREAERTFDSTMVVDLQGVPLKTTLRLCLNQIGLRYAVDEGCLQIKSMDSGETSLGDPLARDDPYLIVGHCLFAWLAAGLGGAAALVISARGRRDVATG